MAVKIPLYPFSLGDNDCYLYLIESYIKDKQTSWSIDYLVDEYGKAAFDELLDTGVLVKGFDETAKLSFKAVNTTTYALNKYIHREVCTFRELMDKLHCTSAKLKSYIAYLINFNEAQYAELPASAIPIISGDSVDGEINYIEEFLNRAYKRSDRLDTRCIHQISPYDGATEFRDLCDDI